MSDSDPREKWSELSTLVDTLLDAEPSLRPALIDQLSGGDATRRAELENLLIECEREPSLLSRPAAERFAALFDDYVPHFPAALAERYQYVSELGRGGMATVYLARDLKHARDVAVKVVHPAVAQALGPGRFLREIEIVAQLHHPHIIPLYDSGEADGALFYVMPYEAEPSLRKRLARDGAFPVADALLILRDVCDALAFAHQRGIVHRDVKPDNVLLSGQHALLTDFGIAEATEGAAAGQIRFGTPAYMAPEQLVHGAAVDHRADIYSVGVLAHELLTGHPPTDLATHRPDLPAPLAELVMQCLEKRPDDRPQSATELVERLDALSARQRVPERPMWQRVAIIGGALAAVAIAVFIWQRASEQTSWRARWTNARISRLTDFAGSEVDASISPDGGFVAFLADRDSVFDAFFTRVGTEQFVNLTGGRFPQLYNEDVRNVGFAGDTAHVWIRVADITSPASVSMLSASGGTAQPFLKTAVMAAWSPNGSRVAYHETTPGDPIYVADSSGQNPRRIFIAAPGVHSHHLSWSPDGRFLYFSHGLPPDEMDIWRIPSDSGAAERITTHSSRVAYPVLLDDRTLVYTATAGDGTGPWLYMMNMQDRVPQRVTTAIEHYISVAASSEVSGKPRRLVATVSNPSVQLWSVPLTDSIAAEKLATSIPLPTSRAVAPRFGPDSTLWYLASRAGADGVWRLAGGNPSEVWKSNQGTVAGAVAVSPDGKRVCFPVRRAGRSTLYCTNADGTGAHAVADSLDVRGAASWSPDGAWIAVAARVGTGSRIFKIPSNGGAPTRLTDSSSSNPVWSPDGTFIVYSGTPRARSAPLKAVTPDGLPHPLPPLSVDRVGDSYRFLPNGKALVVKLGGFRRQDFWLLDLASGKQRRLTALRPGESLQRFDVSRDGTRIVFERLRENSDIVMIELPIR